MPVTQKKLGSGVSPASGDPQAYALAQSQNPTPADAGTGLSSWYERCQTFVRTALGFGPGVPGGDTAATEYAYTKKLGNIHTDRNPPANVPVYFKSGTDGHVALSAGGGNVWTTDLGGAGTVSKQKISDVEKWLGAGSYLGWGQTEGVTQLSFGGTTDLNVAGPLKDDAGNIVSGVAGDVGNAIVSAFKSVFTSDFMKRLGAALAGGLLILMALYKLSGMTAVPIPV